MPNRIAAISALLILALLGCQDSEDGSPTSIVLGDSAKMGLRLVVPTNLNIDSGEVTITKGDLEYSQTVDLQDGSATVLFTDIQPGIWQIVVALYDEDGFLLYEGSGDAEVQGGQTTSAHIVLTESTGGLEVTIELPPGEEGGLVAYYPFSGSAADQSGNGHDGEVHGATLTNDRFGNPESAYHFDGVGDRINIGNEVKPPLPISVSLWVKFDDVNGDTGHDLFINDLEDGNWRYYGVYVRCNDGQLTARFNSGGVASPGTRRSKRTDEVVFTDGQWYHVAVVFVNANDIRLYVDGSERSGTYGGNATTLGYSDHDGYLGSRENPDGSFEGKLMGDLDEVRIYDRVLEADEILELGRDTPGDYVLIPPGAFTMGSPIDEPAHDDHETLHAVTLTQGFYMATTEVTEEWWDVVMGSGATTSQLPRASLSWDDAVAFCNQLSLDEELTPAYVINGPNGDVTWNREANGYRLPTEAEWEYACRAGSQEALCNGPITSAGCEPLDPNLDQVGWYCGNSEYTDIDVGQKNANAWGLHDMHGNIWEWVWDGYREDYQNLPADDPAYDAEPVTNRVLRGGSWNNDSQHCRSALRHSAYPSRRHVRVGFRPVRSAN